MKKNHRSQENGHFSAIRKTEAVLGVCSEYKVTAAKLSQ
jgi:hypothetical protein